MLKGTTIKYDGLPEGLQESMRLYMEAGISGGGFLDAVLQNDLLLAVIRADNTNLEALPDIVKWIHWEAPKVSYGSRETVLAWIDGFKPIEDRRYLNDGV